MLDTKIVESKGVNNQIWYRIDYVGSNGDIFMAYCQREATAKLLTVALELSQAFFDTDKQPGDIQRLYDRFKIARDGFIDGLRDKPLEAADGDRPANG